MFLSIRFLLMLLCSVLMVQSLRAQQNPCDQSLSEQLSGVIVGVNRTVGLPIAFTLNKKVNGATVKVSADVGEDYIFGRSWDYPFSAVISFQLDALDASSTVVPGVFNNSTYTITLDNDHPEASFVKDFSSLVGTGGTFSFSKFKVTLTAVSVTTSGSTPSSVLSQISSNLRVFLGYDLKYGFNLTGATAPSASMSSQNITGTREVTFSWNAGTQEFCNYQLQLLRLYNNDISTSLNEQTITAKVDWSGALTVQTESAATALKLTVAEGQGYYVWRVRPIGTYYPGGIANPLNLSESLWSTAPADGATLNLPGGLGSNPTLFFLNDPDDNINRIYSRTFTEGNKVSETSTYANSLMQVKQTQSYLPSVDTTLVVQHVLDLSGRPALTTMPAPQDSSMFQGYKSKFMQTETSVLYRDTSYDSDANYNNPLRAKQTTGAYQYYSSGNTNNPNIADAQGYPYQRTQYYNDGTDRVKQQSGVGKQQMIGTGSSADSKGEGKTVRTYYGTASEAELIQLFGDEAPSSENVFKTINVDQNNTATITLTNKEGKVIATALSFQDVDNSGVFASIDGEGERTTLTTVSDSITVNTRTANGFVSSKRLAVMQTTTMNVGYQISCDTLNLPCANGEVDCGYHLKIQLFNLDSNTTHVLYDNDLKNITCSSVTGKTGTYKTVTLDPLTLAPGSYIIQKNLTTGSVSVAITAAQDKIDIQTGPITGLIKGWLADVKCPPQLNDFFVKLRTLSNNIKAHTITSYGFPSDFMTIYNADPSGFDLTITPDNGDPQHARLKTPCCGDLSVPINWVPPFNCPVVPRLVDKNGNGKIDVRDYNPYGSPDSLDQPEEFFPDFEGYARVFLRECWDSTEFYGTYMEGWKPGEFNLMIYHMLTDQYNCSNNYPEKDTSAAQQQLNKLSDQTNTIYNSCGDSIGSYTSSGLSFGCGDSLTLSIYDVPTKVSACPQYTCDALFACWSTQLAAVRAKRCLDIDYEQEDNNVGNKSDAQDSDGKNGFNDNFDKNAKGGGLLGKWIAKRAVSKRMRDLQAGGSGTITPTYDRHVVQDFLQCTGYRFAKVLTQYDPYPLPADSGGTIDYTVAAVNDTSALSTAGKGNGDYYYIPFSNWRPGKTNTTGTPTPSEANTRQYKGFFPFIKNPIYAFKYFEYPYESTDDYQDIEAMTCYSDPNDCYKTFDPAGVVPAVRIPCCVTVNHDGSYNTSQCYKDYKYPNLARLPLDPDSSHPTFGILSDGGGKYKLTVSDFCGVGRYGCEYTKDVWSCGQRTAFYLALKNYQVPSAAFVSIYDQRNCDFSKSVQSWYLNPQSEDNNFPDTISYSEAGQIVSSLPGYTWADFSAITSFKTLSGATVSTISEVEMNMVKQNSECKQSCENRRTDIETALYDLLTSKCYVIGPCKTNEDYVADNVIPQEDFDAMVDGVIAQCNSQCAINTFKCFPVAYCRLFKTKKDSLGYNEQSTVINYGTGGTAADVPLCPLVTGHDYYDCSGAEDSTLSYCQYTKYKEASGWYIQLDIESACSGKEHARDFTCDEDNDTCVPKDSYEKTGKPTTVPTVTTSAVPVNVHVDE